MIQLVKLEFNKIKYIYFISIVVAILSSLIMVTSVVTGYRYDHNIQIWEQSGDVFRVFFPIFAVLPTCWLMYYEKLNGFMGYVHTRVSLQKYITIKWLTVSFFGASIVFLVSFTSLIISLYFIPEVVPSLTDKTINRYAGYYLVHKPFLYGFLLCLWKGVIGFLIASLGFSLSLYVNNLLLILVGPFIYLMLENFLLAILNVPYFRLITSFDPSSLSSSVIHTHRLLIGPILLIVFTSGFILYFKFIRGKTLLD